MSGNRSKIIAFNYFGGKFTWIDNLYAYFPQEYNHLVDVFGGSFVVSLNAPGKIIRTANDINEDITNFFYVLRDHTDELLLKLELTPCAVAEYNACWEKSECKIENARRFYVRVRQSFFGLGAQRKNKGWHMAIQHANAHGGETVSRWNNALKKLYKVAEILRQNFQITNYNYDKVIDVTNHPGTHYYIDYPYDEETRASKNDYKFEITDNMRIDLANQLHVVKGTVMVSGYPGGITEELYKDWEMIKFPQKRNNIRSSLRKIGDLKVQECIWINYDYSITRKAYQEFQDELKKKTTPELFG